MTSPDSSNVPASEPPRRTLVRPFYLFLAALIALALTQLALTVSRKKLEQQVVTRLRQVQTARLATEEWRRTSDELSRMARTFAATNNPAFENYYAEIVAIRDGRKPRPVAYDKVYWDLVIPVGSQPTNRVQAIAFEEIIKLTGATDAELAMWEQAKAKNGMVTLLEQIAINATKGIFRDARGQFASRGQPDTKYATRILYGPEYHRARAQMLNPVRQFQLAIEHRGAREVARLEARLSANAVWNTAIAGAGVILLLVMFVVFRRNLVEPLAELASSAAAVGRNGFFRRVLVTRTNELGTLASALNRMSETVEAKTEETAAAESRFRGLLEALPEAIVIANDETRIVLSNQSALALSGYSGEELANQSVQLLLRPGSGEEVVGRISEIARGTATAPTLGMTATLCRKDASEVPVEILLRSLTAADVTLVCCVIRETPAVPEQPVATSPHELERAEQQLADELAAATVTLVGKSAGAAATTGNEEADGFDDALVLVNTEALLGDEEEFAHATEEQAPAAEPEPVAVEQASDEVEPDEVLLPTETGSPESQVTEDKEPEAVHEEELPEDKPEVPVRKLVLRIPAAKQVSPKPEEPAPAKSEPEIEPAIATPVKEPLAEENAEPEAEFNASEPPTVEPQAPEPLAEAEPPHEPVNETEPPDTSPEPLSNANDDAESFDDEPEPDWEPGPEIEPDLEPDWEPELAEPEETDLDPVSSAATEPTPEPEPELASIPEPGPADEALEPAPEEPNELEQREATVDESAAEPEIAAPEPAPEPNPSQSNEPEPAPKTQRKKRSRKKKSKDDLQPDLFGDFDAEGDEAGPVEVTIESDGTPVVPGMELREAMNRLDLSGTDVRTKVIEFSGTLTRLFGDLRTALAAEDLDAARQHAHAIAGAAGELSADTLRRLAKTLELAIKFEQGDTAKMLAELEHEAARLVEGARQLEALPENNDSAAATGSLSGSDLRRLRTTLEELAAALEDADQEAIATAAERLKQQLLPDELAAIYEKLTELVDAGDYAEAADLAQSMLRRQG